MTTGDVVFITGRILFCLPVSWCGKVSLYLNAREPFQCCISFSKLARRPFIFFTTKPKVDPSERNVFNECILVLTLLWLNRVHFLGKISFKVSMRQGSVYDFHNGNVIFVVFLVSYRNWRKLYSDNQCGNTPSRRVTDITFHISIIALIMDVTASVKQGKEIENYISPSPSPRHISLVDSPSPSNNQFSQQQCSALFPKHSMIKLCNSKHTSNMPLCLEMFVYLWYLSLIFQHVYCFQLDSFNHHDSV